MSVHYVGGSDTSGSHPLNNDAIFRIEVSLSSQKSSVVVMRCTARLYSLEGMKETTSNQSGDSEWKSVAYGVPCILLMRETVENNSPFYIKLVIAEVESGIALWECYLGRESKYNAMQNNFHTFMVSGKPHAVQFAHDGEACRFLESVQDLFFQRERAETVSFESKKNDVAIFKRVPSNKKLNKRDISAPCNFKHVSGITLQRTRTCEDELRGTIQRKMHSFSLSSLTRQKTKSHPRSRPSSSVMDDSIGTDIIALEESPSVSRRHMSDSTGNKSSNKSLIHRLGSFRNSKKKQQQHTPLTVTELHHKDSGVSAVGQFDRSAPHRRSLPPRLQRQAKLAMNRPSSDGVKSEFNPSRLLSQSSGNVNVYQPLPQPNHVPTSAAHRGGQIERRHTMQGKGTFSYTPYSHCIQGNIARKSAEEDTTKKSATLDRFSSRRINKQQLQRDLRGRFGKQYTSDQYLNRNTGLQRGGARGVAYQGGTEASGYNKRSSYHEPSALHGIQDGNVQKGTLDQQATQHFHSLSWQAQSSGSIAAGYNWRRSQEMAQQNAMGTTMASSHAQRPPYPKQTAHPQRNVAKGNPPYQQQTVQHQQGSVAKGNPPYQQQTVHHQQGSGAKGNPPYQQQTVHLQGSVVKGNPPYQQQTVHLQGSVAKGNPPQTVGSVAKSNQPYQQQAQGSVAMGNPPYQQQNTVHSQRPSYQQQNLMVASYPQEISFPPPSDPGDNPQFSADQAVFRQPQSATVQGPFRQQPLSSFSRVPSGTGPPPSIAKAPSTYHTTVPGVPKAVSNSLQKENQVDDHPPPYSVVMEVGTELQASSNPIPGTSQKRPVAIATDTWSSSFQKKPTHMTTDPQTTSDQYDLLDPHTNPHPVPVQVPSSQASIHTNNQYGLLNPHSKPSCPVPVQVPAPQAPPQWNKQVQSSHPQSLKDSTINPIQLPINVLTSYDNPNHAKFQDYPRGYVTTTTMAAQQIRTDTHVSPSHSKSKVYPLLAHDSLGNESVQQAFNPVPIPVQGPVVPHVNAHLQAAGHGYRTSYDAEDSFNKMQASPDQSLRVGGHPSRYKTAIDSSKFQPNMVREYHGYSSTNSSFDGNDSVSGDSGMNTYTDKMTRALQQFDSLVNKKSSVIQTSF